MWHMSPALQFWGGPPHLGALPIIQHKTKVIMNLKIGESWGVWEGEYSLRVGGVFTEDPSHP